MKLLLVTATAIAVFTVDCRDFSSEPEGPGTDSKVQLFPEDIEEQGKIQNFPDGPDGNNLAENQDSDYNDLQMKEEKREQHQSLLRRSKCKARNACVVMGGFCVTNATLCGSGRLVPEGCKGNNCQCCIPGTLEAKMDQMEVAINNIYSNISSLLESQCKHKVTTSPVPMTTVAPASTPLATTSPVPPTTTAPATTTPATTSPVPLTTTAPATTPPVTTSPVPLTTTAPSTKPPAVCSEASGFFKVPNSGNHCYKLFTDSQRSWQASKAKCQDEGLLLAKPQDPVAMRKYIVETFGDKRVWVGGQGTGGSVEWIRDGSTLSSSNSAWYPGWPGSNTSTSDCLTITATQSNMDRYPTKPYYMQSCIGSNKYALCEVAM